MKIDEKFTFGQYRGITLKSVYQGRPQIDKEFLATYLRHCLLDKTAPRPVWFELCEIVVTTDRIIILPQIFDEEKKSGPSNEVSLGDLSNDLQSFFNYFFRINSYGTILSKEHFNKGETKHVLAGDPEYITW